MEKYKAIKNQDNFSKNEVYEFERVKELGQYFYSHSLKLDDGFTLQVLIPEDKFFDYFEKLEKESESRELTFGEKLVGKSFNPSKNEKVDRLKELFSEATDIIDKHSEDLDLDLDFEKLDDDYLRISHGVFSSCISDILKAQMMCVKFVTLHR